MTRRKRVKNKWHFTIGNFQAKKASYNSDGTHTFEVWFKGNIIGFCYATRSWRLKSSDISTINILDNTENKKNIGTVFCNGNSKNGFPTNIVKIELYPFKINFANERKVIFEKIIKKLDEDDLTPDCYP